MISSGTNYCLLCRGPNDAHASEMLDIFHATLVMLFDGKLYTSPLDEKKIQHVIDIGTGTGKPMNLNQHFSPPFKFTDHLGV